MYKWAYRHVRQPTSTSCSWTSYVICAGNVANAFYRGYPVNRNQVYRVMTGCDTSKLITTLSWYANRYDRNYVHTDVSALRKSTSTYLDVIKKMLTMLYQNKTPFVTIAKSGSYGHYVTVYSIYWNKGLTGSLIYFTDSLDPDHGSFNANVKSMDLGTFLYKMRTNSNNFYNFLRVLP
jgi:membrane-bound inhibitor of C-type lysozyme